MKNITLIIATAVFAFACTSEAKDGKKDAEDEVKVELGKSYGPVKVDIKKAISSKDMVADFATKTEDTQYTFEAELSTICSKAGCFVEVAKEDGETFMVRFKDHFTIPPATKVGTGAYIHGTAYWDTVSVDMQRHFLDDKGKSLEEQMEITEPKYTMGFEGDGITLKK